jgi:hypothetical protein
MAQIQFKGKPFVQNHHLLVKYHELIQKKGQEFEWRFRFSLTHIPNPAIFFLKKIAFNQ